MTTFQSLPEPDRVKCIECDNLILPQTAAANAGLCGQCVKISPKLRAETREYERVLAAGLVFVPSEQERATSSSPGEIRSAHWELQPEYYAERKVNSVVAAIAAARNEVQGNVFLVTANGGELCLGFTARYGVCEYQNHESGEFRYAYSCANLREQVSGEFHVVQACPCCGVGMLWYPSRYHMPRDEAFLILENASANRDTPSIEWLECDDFSHTQRGRG